MFGQFILNKNKLWIIYPNILRLLGTNYQQKLVAAASSATPINNFWGLCGRIISEWLARSVKNGQKMASRCRRGASADGLGTSKCGAHGGTRASARVLWISGKMPAKNFERWRQWERDAEWNWRRDVGALVINKIHLAHTAGRGGDQYENHSAYTANNNGNEESALFQAFAPRSASIERPRKWNAHVYIEFLIT